MLYQLGSNFSLVDDTYNIPSPVNILAHRMKEPKGNAALVGKKRLTVMAS